MFFSLRNYKLHLDQIIDLDLQAEEYSQDMADALAVLHWHTRIDAMDIEFVLGSSPVESESVRKILSVEEIKRLPPGASTYEYATNSRPDFKKRVISLWLVDFDACSDISMNEAGVAKALKAFLETDPYCPRPFTEDIYGEHLWTLFQARYQDTGVKILRGSSYTYLPEKFIRGVTSSIRSRQPGPSPNVQPGSSASRRNLGTPSRGGSPSFSTARGSFRGQSHRGWGSEGSGRGGKGKGRDHRGT